MYVMKIARIVCYCALEQFRFITPDFFVAKLLIYLLVGDEWIMEPETQRSSLVVGRSDVTSWRVLSKLLILHLIHGTLRGTGLQLTQHSSPPKKSEIPLHRDTDTKPSNKEKG
eukprot:1826068-Amphidinium_carterae.1